MFIMSAVMLYIAVALLARVRANIHVPPAEPEGGVFPRESHDSTEVEEAGEGSDAQVRSRSRTGESGYDDFQKKLATTLSMSED
jgi:hypothetical protein